MTKIPNGSYYHMNCVTMNLFRLVYWRLYFYLDTVLIFLNIIVIVLPETYEQTYAGNLLAGLSRVISFMFISMTLVRVLSLGLKLTLKDNRLVVELVIMALCIVVSFSLRLK